MITQITVEHAIVISVSAVILAELVRLRRWKEPRRRNHSVFYIVALACFVVAAVMHIRSASVVSVLLWACASAVSLLVWLAYMALANGAR